MWIKRTFGKGFLIALAITLIPAVAISAPKITPGSKCKIQKEKVDYQNKSYTCIKSGKRLVWNKGAIAVKPTSTIKAEDLRQGLLRADYSGYYEDQLDWFASKIPTKTSVVSTIDLRTIEGDNFSVQWTGYFIPNETGKWTLTSTSDDGSGVWIGEGAIKQIPEGVPTLSAPGIHGPYTISKQKYFEKGHLYPIRILFGDKTNWAQMTLSVQSPTFESPTLDLQGLVWHSPISTEVNSGIDPQFAIKQIKKKSEPSSLELPVVTDSSTFDTLDVCQLKNINTFNSVGRGFPTSSGRLPTIGRIKGIVIFVEFNDVQGANDVQKRFDDYTNKFKDFYAAQSYGKLAIEMDNYPKYLRIQKSSSAYGMQTHNGGNPWLYMRDALDAADPFVDFSTYDFVVALPPADIKTIVYGPAFPIWQGDNQLRTNEKVFKNATAAGSDSMLRPGRSWQWLAHEVGHLFGLEHQYTFENVTYSTSLRGIWDLMDTGDTAPGLLAWHRFMLGWLDSGTVNCLDRNSRIGSESIHFISPLEGQEKKPKSVVIRINDFEAIVLEVRRNLGFDKISEDEEGVIAYKVNVRDIGKVQEVMILTNQPYEKGAIIAGNLTPGDRIVDSSVEITVLASTSAGDYIKVKFL
jgi:M6 family metalloprotease-like protein